MKKLICGIIVVLFSLTVMNTYSQQSKEFQAGLKAGANIFQVSGKPFDEEFRFGYHLGVFTYINIGNEWGVQPELLWSTIETRTGTNLDTLYDLGNLTDISLNYLTIPILVTFTPTELLSLQAGPQFGILVNPHQTTVQNGADAFSSGDFSMLFGAQLNAGPVKGGIRYVIGLNNINDVSEQEKWINNGLQIYVGMRIF